MSYCRERLAHYKVPRKIGFVSEYPISPAGKVLRRELRKMKIENFLGTVNRKEKDEQKEEAEELQKKIINQEQEA